MIMADESIPVISQHDFLRRVSSEDLRRVEWLLETQNRSFAAFELLLSRELLINVAAVHNLTEVFAVNDVERYEHVAPEVFWLVLHPDHRVRERARSIITAYHQRGLDLSRVGHVLQTLANLICFAFTLTDECALQTYVSLRLASDEPSIVWPAMAFLLGVLDAAVFLDRSVESIVCGSLTFVRSVWGNSFIEDLVECVVSQVALPMVNVPFAHCRRWITQASSSGRSSMSGCISSACAPRCRGSFQPSVSSFLSTSLLSVAEC
jgi:hypothetical protein